MKKQDQIHFISERNKTRWVSYFYIKLLTLGLLAFCSITNQPQNHLTQHGMKVKGSSLESSNLKEKEEEEGKFQVMAMRAVKEELWRPRSLGERSHSFVSHLLPNFFWLIQQVSIESQALCYVFI